MSQQQRDGIYAVFETSTVRCIQRAADVFMWATPRPVDRWAVRSNNWCDKPDN